MRCLVMGAVAWLALAPAAWAFDGPKDKPQDDKQSPAYAYQALVKEHEEAQEKLIKAYREAKTDEEREKAIQAVRLGTAGFAARFLALAERHPKDAAAVDALIWIVSNSMRGPEAAKAIDLLIRDYLKDAKVKNLVPRMVHLPLPAHEKLIRAYLQASAGDKDAQAQATFHMAQYFKNKADAVGLLRDADAKTLGQVEQMYGKEFIKQLKVAEPQKSLKQAEELLEEITKKYADVRYGQGTLGETVKNDLYELRHLSIGKTAPEIEGADIDGKKFKLSDYRGKVVILDFWGHW